MWTRVPTDQFHATCLQPAGPPSITHASALPQNSTEIQPTTQRTTSARIYWNGLTGTQKVRQTVGRNAIFYHSSSSNCCSRPINEANSSCICVSCVVVSLCLAKKERHEKAQGARQVMVQCRKQADRLLSHSQSLPLRRVRDRTTSPLLLLSHMQHLT